MNKGLKRSRNVFTICIMAAFLFLLPLSVEAADEEYTLEGQNIFVNVEKGENITRDLNSALEAAGELGVPEKIYTVKVPAGSYIISDTLHIYSNTTLDLSGVTLVGSGGNFNMLVTGARAYNKSQACAGYEGYENISLEGGMWISGKNNEKTQIHLFHANNVVVRNLTISGGKSNHQLEVAGIDGLRVENCTFQNMSKSSKATKREALQLDLLCNSSIFPEVNLDGTMMKNVCIKGCTFKNVSRGIGTHSMLRGAYMENIEITGNKFQNVEQEAITALNYYKANIVNNQIVNCGGGILFQYCKSSPRTIFTTIYDGNTKYRGKVRHNAKSVISGNVIKTTYHAKCDENQGIKLYGRKITSSENNPVDGSTIPKGNYYVSGVKVTNNKITTSGYGITLNDAKNCILSGNYMKSAKYSSKDKLAKEKKYSGIYLGEGSTGNVIKNNTILNVQMDGISLQGASSAKGIQGNKITGSGRNGIFLCENSKVTGTISKNIISKTRDNGIVINDRSNVQAGIRDNKIQSAGRVGIYIVNQSTVSNKIRKNVIKKTGQPIVIGPDCRGNTGRNRII